MVHWVHRLSSDVDSTYFSASKVGAGAEGREGAAQGHGSHQLCSCWQPPAHHLLEEVTR